MIKAITFDFWSTLYKTRIVSIADRLQFLKDSIEDGSAYKVDEEALKQATFVAAEAWNNAWLNEYRTMGAGEWISIVLASLQLTISDTHLSKIERNMEDRLLDHLPTLVPDARTILSKLAKDYQLAIISDTGLSPGRVLRQILDQDEVSSYFTRFTFSDEIGYSKPHAEAFHTTLTALNADPHEAVHIGDLLRTDIAGAKGVGMRAVQYVGVSRDSTRVNVTPDAVIQNHTELVSLLHTWNEVVG